MSTAEASPPADLRLPEPSLVVLMGASGSGKSTFARTHFKATEIVSSDQCRGVVSDDENDQSATDEAFALLHHIVAIRLAAGRLTVVDATNVEPAGRRNLVTLARAHDVPPVAIVLDLPERLCARRNSTRTDREVGRDVIRRQRDDLHGGLTGLGREGFATVHVLATPEDVERAVVVRSRDLVETWPPQTPRRQPEPPA